MSNKFLFTAMLALAFSAAVSAQTTITAPESPFGFAPLEMYEFPDKEFSIKRYGAKEGDVKANTEAFAKAMKACNKAGGGKVVVPEGEWLTGPIHFLDNCCLYLSEGATVVFEDDPSLYLPAVRSSWEGSECMNYSPLIYAYECENVAICGPGTLAPKMDFWRSWFSRPENHIQATRQLYAMCSTSVPVEQRDMTVGDANMRPQLIQFNRCRNIRLDGFKIRESPFWTIHIYHSDDIYVRGLDVYAHGHNNDGIDLEMSSHALIEDCTFDQGDDAVVLKAGRNQDGWNLAKPTEDIVVRNCTIVRGHCLLGIGSEMSAGVRRVYMHDCHTTDSVYRLFYIKTNHRRGGFVEDIRVDNVSADKTQRVLEIDTDVMYQWRDIVPTFETAITDIRNITLTNAYCRQADAIYELRGEKSKPIEGVTIENVHVGELKEFINNAEYVRDLQTSNISWDKGPDGKSSSGDKGDGSRFTGSVEYMQNNNAPAYIFSFFTGQADGLHLAYSHDGYHWTAIADNRALLIPEVGKDKLMRDPSICQGPDGNFHMVWTSSWTDRIIGYASSPDLIHWSEQKAIPVMMHEPEAHNCWAPELSYDADSGLFYIYWATTIPGRHGHVETSESEKGLNHRIYYTTTRDFETFSPTSMYYDPGFSVIDAAITRNPADGEYIMVVKNENSAPAEKNLRITRSRSMSEFPTEVSEPIHGDFWAEGPSPLYLEDGTLIVYYDKYLMHEYGASVSHDNGLSWSDVPAGELSFPKGIRHGTAFKVEAEVLQNLLDYYSKAAPKPLYRDPGYDGAADPSIVRDRESGIWYMFYTNRRASIGETPGVEWVHGTPIGIAVSEDLAHWNYLCDAAIDYAPDAEPTYWAPSVIDDGKEYHMYLTYVPGVFADWKHPRYILHLTSSNLRHWEFRSKLELMSEKVIDAEVERMDDGSWRMWYNQEPGGKRIAWAESSDLYNWTDHGLVDGISNCEGPSVFRWKDSWWMVTDEWKGFAVYRSDDALNWTRQSGNILQTPGKGEDDGVAGNHCDVLVKDGRAFIFYFVHPERDGRAGNADVNTRRSLIQVAELESPDGLTISCNRDKLVVF